MKILLGLAVVAWIAVHLILAAVFFGIWLVATPLEFAFDCFDWARRFAKDLSA